LLEALTIKGVPALEGVALEGLAVQLGGAPVPQLSATVPEYPFSATSVPLNCAEELTEVVSDGFLMFKV
jgi:hypothetical protein